MRLKYVLCLLLVTFLAVNTKSDEISVKSELDDNVETVETVEQYSDGEEITNVEENTNIEENTNMVEQINVENTAPKVTETSPDPADDIPVVHNIAEVENKDRIPSDGSVEKQDRKLSNDLKTGKYMNNLSDDLTEESGYNWDDPNNRNAPSEPPAQDPAGYGYVITPARLATIRNNFFYWFFDKDSTGGNGDYQKDIHASMPQVHKNFNYQLPFFGFRYNYTRLSLNGYLEFSDPPKHYTYPLVFPVKDWPKVNDPAFIGIFFSKCRIGKKYDHEVDKREPGVYFRLERDLMTRTDRFGVEVRERVQWDIREGVVGADTFIPKHVIIATWKNMSFAGGIDNSLYTTNSFQMVLATDEVYTYAIFNYAIIKWSSHTEAGGDTTLGEGGIPAYIGFNGGNGTQSYEYKPYSQASVLRDLTGRGWANGFPGRHIFRIDEKIMLGTCNKDIDASQLPLVFAPESGNMLGGTVVNITGPCFDKNDRVLCHFDTEDVVGHVIDRNRAMCVQPFLKAQGYIRFEISIGNERFKWRGKYFVETPALATEYVFFDTSDVFTKNPAEIKISWSQFNLTANANANVRISLWGYRESTIKPQLEYIDMIENGIANSGLYTIAPGNYRTRDNWRNNDMQFGFLQINLTNPEDYSGLKISPILWSRPIPLGWYFGPQWERIHGKNWPRALCENWFRTDRFLRNFAAEIPLCPCTLEHAVLDKGRFLPDLECDKDYSSKCLYHDGAMHCVRSGQPSHQGSEQQCCYDRYGYLMMSYDQKWGSRPRRTHNIGQMPWNEAGKVPTLSTWFHDIRPFYSCCMWQDEQDVGCETMRFERRPSQDCVAYQAPGVAAVFGDPHFVTFDNLHYTFNGMGEFVLAKGNDGQEKFEVQGRFEKVHKNIYGEVAATHLTSVATRGNTSTIIEVRLRPPHAQWRYRLDVFADGRRIYFDRPSLKFQYFHGVTVYTPTTILNQSEVIIMYSSGVGVEVVENEGFMTARVYAPWSYINKTSGLFGKWSFDMQDDFLLPDGRSVSINLNSFDSMHNDFAKYWMLSDRELPGVGAALFTREFGRTASYFSNISFVPNFKKEPKDFLPPNRTQDIERATELCGESYQCRFDYGMSLDRDMAHFTKNYFDSAVNIKTITEKRVVSCGVLETPRFGRKMSFKFTPGSKVTFDCNEGFVLMGDHRRVCSNDGRWSLGEGYTECLREVYYTQRMAWLATGIIIAVIVPIMMCIVCGVYCYRKKAKEHEPNWKMSLPRSRSGSRASLRHMNSDASENQDTLPKSRSYEKVYRTNEPLEGKPNIEFPEKKWDLEDEDITSSEGSEFKDSKIARDIEYINKTGERPRQTGRRSLRNSQGGTNPIEEEAPAYQLQHLDALRPHQYSPTFSGIDRNSGSSAGNTATRSPIGGVPVFPTVNSGFYNQGPASPASTLRQDVGLPSNLSNTKSTDV